MSTREASAQRVFISYRREDSAAYAGRIYDSMVARFGEGNVFMDVEMAPGIDFVERIHEVVSSCAALIVVIGPNWAAIEDAEGRPRLHDEGDFVRQEVTAACQRPEVTVIPALVGKAQMPRAEQLPEELRPLTRRNALELSDGRWRYDVGRLAATLDAPGSSAPAALRGPDVPDAQLLAEGVAVAAATALIARWVSDWIPKLNHEPVDFIDTVIRQGVSWAAVGTVLALWLGARTRRTDFAFLAVLGLVVGALAGTLGGLIWALSVAPPPIKDWTAAEEATGERWTVVNFAVTGALIGALLGTLWRYPRLLSGLAAGLAGGVLVQLLLNVGGLNTESMPGITFIFSVRAAAIVAAALVTMVLLDRRVTAAAPLPAAQGP